MAYLKLPPSYNEKSVLIADDEPEHLDWLVAYLERFGFIVKLALTVEEAMKVSQDLWHRAYIIDLNIPLGDWPESKNSLFVQYPGMVIIQAIRSQGNDGRRVIAYSAHSNEQILSQMSRLYTDYVAKGRPDELKQHIQDMLTRKDLTAAALERRTASLKRRRELAAERRAAAKSGRTKAPSKGGFISHAKRLPAKAKVRKRQSKPRSRAR